MDSIALLRSLLDKAEAERDTAAAVLRQAEAQARHSRDQASQLRAYQTDYDQRWTLRFRQSGTRELLQCQQSFGQRLTQAIDQQHGNSNHLASRVERARALLLAREQRVGAVRKLIERRLQAQQRNGERRDQRGDDELAQRLHQRRAVNPC